MSLPFRPAPLLLAAALLGAVGVAMASPQQRRGGDHRPRPAMQEGRGAQEARGDRDQRPRMPPPPQQQDWTQRPQQRQQRRGQDGLSDSVRRVEQRTRGQVLTAEPVPYDGRNVNRIKYVDPRGRVHVYMDDPQQAPDPGQAPDAPPTRDNDD